MKNILTTILLSTLILSCSARDEKVNDIPTNKVIPSANQYKYQQMEMVGFIHFTVNTFTDKEWGYGDEDPKIFNPTNLDAEQWVIAAKEGGLKELILTTKHHDGFCLWPSKYTEHSVKNSLYKNGKGDIVKEFVDACRKHRLKVGFYLSPWDRNHKDYGKPEYIVYYRNQLRELLTNYGEINEIWFDGANGGDGYYGGANEERVITKDYYHWDETIKLVKELQPNILIFSDAGPDIHWIGNEQGFAGKTFWSTFSYDSVTIGHADRNYLNTGDPNGKYWVIGQCDVSIRPGWFYHKSQDNQVKSPQELVDIYYKSVGRNAVLLLNLPPDRTGLIHQNDVNSLKDFKSIIDETFKTNLALNAKVTCSNYRLKDNHFSPENITDNDLSSYWATDDGVIKSELTIKLDTLTTFDRILLQEPIKFGQRISKFEVWIKNKKNEWKQIANETTIGYKRLLRVSPVTTTKVKIKIVDANNLPALSNVGLFLASEKETKQD